MEHESNEKVRQPLQATAIQEIMSVKFSHFGNSVL
jgi:hypothetical protein